MTLLTNSEPRETCLVGFEYKCFNVDKNADFIIIGHSNNLE